MQLNQYGYATIICILILCIAIFAVGIWLCTEGDTLCVFGMPLTILGGMTTVATTFLLFGLYHEKREREQEEREEKNKQELIVSSSSQI